MLPQRLFSPLRTFDTLHPLPSVTWTPIWPLKVPAAEAG